MNEVHEKMAKRMKEAKKIYLDVCALSRPFDDQRYLRIRLETDAVNLILSKIKEGKFKMMVSPVHIKEIEAIPTGFERIELLELLKEYGETIHMNMQKIRQMIVGVRSCMLTFFEAAGPLRSPIINYK